jgi:hypothetical protein
MLFGCQESSPDTSTSIDNLFGTVNELKNDTLEIINDSIANNPFFLEGKEINLDDIFSIFPREYSAKLKLERNIFDTSLYDTNYCITNGYSYFKFSCVSKRLSIIEAELVDRSVKVRANLRIGNDYQHIIKILGSNEGKALRVQSIFIYNNFGALNQLILEFKNNKLARIRYYPYIG